MQLLSLVVILMLSLSGLCDKSITSVFDLFYQSIDSGFTAPCFRLANATHQIGCSASSSQTRGVVYYVDEMSDITLLNTSAPHAPYVVVMEPKFFSGNIVKMLKSWEHKVNGIIVRYEANLSMSDSVFLSDFSAERRCPNELFGQEGGCMEGDWNEYGTDLLFTDFGDFPIFMLLTEKFEDIIECYNMHNNKSSGGYGDYPLCSVEMVADMALVADTPTCFRRQGLPIPYLNADGICDPLGDLTVWGSLYNLVSSNYTNEVIMLAAKLDSVSFFPNVLSYGASSEVAAIATLLAVLQQLGKIKQEGAVLRKPILYSFFHGESWDYIGSSRMAYDMERGNFPENEVLPRLNLSSIEHYLELGQLGLISDNTVYVHGDKESPFIQRLKEFGETEGITVENSTRQDLPPASLQRLIRESDNIFSGSVLASFNSKFVNRFFGSRFDDQNNFRNGSIAEAADTLAKVATVVAKTVFNVSDPCCGPSCDPCNEEVNITADSQLIEDVLNCFLVRSNCDLFKNVLLNSTAMQLRAQPLSRYVTVNTQVNSETIIMKQLVAYLTANNASHLKNPVMCSECLSRMTDDNRDKALNITWMQMNSTHCFCVESYTYTHSATSPAFDFKSIGHNSRDYSTWTESRWNSFGIRLYVVTYPLQEVGFLLLGLFLTAITFLVSLQCTRKGNEIFAVGRSFTVLAT